MLPVMSLKLLSSKSNLWLIILSWDAYYIRYDMF